MYIVLFNFFLVVMERMLVVFNRAPLLTYTPRTYFWSMYCLIFMFKPPQVCFPFRFPIYSLPTLSHSILSQISEWGSRELSSLRFSCFPWGLAESVCEHFMQYEKTSLQVFCLCQRIIERGSLYYVGLWGGLLLFFAVQSSAIILDHPLIRGSG